MGSVSEIYLTKKFVSKDDWLKLIKIISDYNGFLRGWKIIITNDKNQIRYFVKTRCTLPATINNLDSFLLKSCDDVKVPKASLGLPVLFKAQSSVLDIINFCEIKNKGSLKFLEISFFKLYEDKIISRVYAYLKKDGLIRKHYMFWSLPANILSVDFEGNKRYFYKGAPKYLEINKVMHLLNSDASASILKVDTFPYLQGDFYLKQGNYSFDKHSIIMGSSGCGKSKFISSLIYNIGKSPELRQKYKVVVIDPHAALEDDIGGFGRVIDFNSDFDSVNLFINSNDDVVSSTELLLDLFKSLISDQYNSKLERVLRHSIYLLLTDESFNFSNLRKLILELDYRNGLIKKLRETLPASVIDFFLSDFNDLKTKAYGEAISPIIGFIDEMEMLPVFNGSGNASNIKDTIYDNFLTLFSLDRTKLGDKVTKTISGLIMQQMLTMIQKREIFQHIIFIIDEVSVVENPILSKFLSEARKYNLSLILAGQYFNQISTDLKNSIFANVINYYIFRVSKLDAELLVNNFNMKIPLDNSKERKIKLLTELNNRECVVRLDNNGILLPAFKARTLDYKSIPRIKNTIITNSKDKKSSKGNKSNNFDFSMSANVSLKDILISSSTSRKGFEKNG